MKRKPVKKLHLKVETLHYLSRAYGAGTDYMCSGGNTIWDTCTEPLPVPSVDGCATGPVACASQNPPGCNSGHGTCLC